MISRPDIPYKAQLVATQELWEPLWRLKTRLTDAESSLLHSSALRRLQYIHHSGCSFINTQHNATRLQHTLGVFSLVAYYCPDWLELRVAALLHDIGHSPFSHTLEQLAGIDHHTQTERLLHAPEVSGILLRYGFRPTEILDIINGSIASPLCNKANMLNLDHLDSWVRSGHLTGVLTIPTQELLANLVVQGSCISADPDTAELLLQLIISEAMFHCSSTNIGPHTVLKNLVARLIEHQVLAPEELVLQTDSWLESQLMNCERTAGETKRLFYRPHEIRVTRDHSAAPDTAYIAVQKKLYLSTPAIRGDEGLLNTLPSFPLLDEMTSLLGTYYVFWECGE